MQRTFSPLKFKHAKFFDKFFTCATNLINGIKQPDKTIKALTPKQVADILGHTTSQITEMYYVKKDTARLSGATDGFEI